MLVELKKLNIINEGYNKIKVNLEKVYVNSEHIISIRDYHGAKEFLLSEGPEEFAYNEYSLVRVNNISGPEEIIALGSSESLFSKLNNVNSKRILNG